MNRRHPERTRQLLPTSGPRLAFALALALGVVTAEGRAEAPAGAAATLRAQTQTLNRAVAERTRSQREEFRTARTINLRAAPGTETSILAVLPAGTAVIVNGTEADGQWSRVQVGGLQGFVRSDLLIR